MSFVSNSLIHTLRLVSAVAVLCYGTESFANCGLNAFRDNGDGTVTDAETGLTWKRCAEGGTYAAGTCQFANGKATELSWARAVQHASATKFAGKGDWRLPSQAEVNKIISSCQYIDKSASDGYPGTRYGDGSPKSLWTYEECENPSQDSRQKEFFGPAGWSVGAGRQPYCQERNPMPLLLVRSESSSPEFAKAKDRAAPAVSRAQAREVDRERQRVDSEKQLKAFGVLGKCEIGETIYHRVILNTSSSSGNPLADAIWASQTQAQYVIEYEAVVEGFVGNKVKSTVNDYRVKQISKGGYVDAAEMRSRVSSIADKLVGKTQFYERTRCAK